MKTSKIKLGIITLIAFCTIPIFSKAVDLDVGIEKEKVKINENGIIETKIPYNRNKDILSSFLTRRVGAYATDSKYNLKNDISLKVKDQGDTSLCWAYSTNTVLESVFAKNKEENVVLSESYLDEQTAKTYNRKINSVGNALIALSYYTTGNGMQKETGEQLNKILNNYEMFPSIMKKKINGQTKYYDSESKELTIYDVNNIRNKIKNHILKYGAVTATIYSDDDTSYYGPIDNEGNNTLKAYYIDNNYAYSNHQITIVGWDDNYSIDNFNPSHRPNNPGAYIVQNSYGEDIFENGYLYISYEDILIENNIYGVKEVSDIEYKNIYQYDELGGNNMLYLTNSDIYVGNIYNRDSSSKNEYLYEVGIHSFVGGKCEIYVNNLDGTLSSSSLTKVQTVDNIDLGYTTVKLDKPIRLKGSKFVVVAKFFKEDGERSYASIEENQKDTFWSTATAQAGQSVYSSDMNTWEDLIDIDENANFCVKAFSKEMENKELEINSSKYKILDNYIINIDQNTSINDFKTILNSNTNVDVLDKNGNKVSNSDIIKTGMKIKGEDESQFILVVKGDVNGDGRISLIDLTNIKFYLIGKKQLTQEAILAGDINSDNKTSLNDLVKLKFYLVGKITI